MKRFSVIAAVAALLLANFTSTAQACPFCSAVQMTFTEEVDASDMAVFAELTDSPADSGELDSLDPVAAAEAARAKFRVVEVLKGESHMKVGDQVEALYFGEASVGSKFMIMGIDPEETMWSTPIEISPRVEEYINHMLSLPREDVRRLLHAWKFLEDEEEALRLDTYDEFAKSEYDLVKQLRGKIDHDQLIAWIKDPETPASRQRLYFTLLGVNGSEKDLPMLEEMLTSDDKKKKTGLDSMIACYVQLGGPETLPLIEKQFISNTDAEYTDTYAAIMALRFHGQETDVVPKERLVQAFRLMLDRPKLADLVIPDLARWEDWGAMPQMVKLFKEADKSTSWVRVPVVNFLRACPLPEAQEHLEELAKIDPDAVKRASTFFPFSGSTEKPGEEGEKSEAEGEPASTEETNLTSEPPRDETATAAPAAAEGDPEDLPPAPEALGIAEEGEAEKGEAEETVAAAEQNEPAAAIVEEEAEETVAIAPYQRPSLLWFIGVPVAAVLLLLAAFAMILRVPAAPRRSSDAAIEQAAK